MISDSTDVPRPGRWLLRRSLLAERDTFVARPEIAAADAALAGHLADVITALEPEQLGAYWAMRSEFNAAPRLVGDAHFSKLPLALPFAHRAPVAMEYRLWDRKPPKVIDDWGVPAAEGSEVVPDVVIVPCLGYTRSGFRLGYGGGYFDRWLARHPHVVAIGVAWSVGELGEDAFAPEPHDRRLTSIVTEQGVIRRSPTSTRLAR